MRESKREFARVYRVIGDKVSGYLIPGREALVQSHLTGVHEIARVGHYVAIPVGADLIVGIVTSLKVEEHEPLAKRQVSQSLEPDIWRIVDISLVGTISPISEGGEVRSKFKRGVLNYPTIDDPIWFVSQDELKTIFGLEAPENINKYIWIASLASNDSLRVCLDTNKFFGLHSAVLGSTGAGKSCTVAAIIQDILDRKNERSSLFPSARFLILDINGEYSNAFLKRPDCVSYKVKIPSDGEEGCITIPYWLFNFQEFRLMFTPSAQTQLPRLRAAIQFLRTDPDGYDDEWAASEEVLTGPDLQGPFDAIQNFFQKSTNRSADDPVYFPIDKLVHVIRDMSIRLRNMNFQGDWGFYPTRDTREAEYLATLVERIRSYTLDCAFQVVFSLTQDKSYDIEQFRQLLLGNLQNRVTILDLSFIPPILLPTITNLIGRIVYETFQSATERATKPFVLVLEEAHNYLPRRPDSDQTEAGTPFERIAKEGRKFGVGLMLASQRPGELSETALSQCGTLIVHRLTNPVDKSIVRAAVSDIDEDILRMLPSLGTRHAVILGETVRAPARVMIDSLPENKRPKSEDPDYVGFWQDPHTHQTMPEMSCDVDEFEDKPEDDDFPF